MLLLLLIGMIAPSDLISGDLITIPGQLGSDLLVQLKDACPTSRTYPFDIYSTKGKIGTYHEGIKGLGSYDGRLMYDQETCTVTLSKLTEADGTKFHVRFLYGIDGKSGQHYINYTVIMKTSDSRTPDPPHLTFNEPTTHNESQDSTGRLLSFVSFCFSLDSVVNAIFTLVLWILIQKGSCKRLDEHSVNFACRIICCFMVLFQVISICLISSGKSNSLFLISIPFILLMDLLLYFGCLPGCVGDRITTFMDRFSCTCCNDDSRCKQIFQYIWRGFILLLQVGFTVCVGIECYTIDDDISRQQSPNIGYAFLVVILSSALKTGVFLFAYCCKTKRNGFTQAPSEEDKTAPDKPGNLGEASA